MPQPTFTDLDGLRALCLSPLPCDAAAMRHIADREALLTKPPGSLGRLEELTRWLGEWQHRSEPRLDHVQCIVFAGNHGVVAQGVSAWPAEVTALMVRNFQTGGAAINQLARVADATLVVLPLEELRPTQDFTLQPAMTEETFLRVVQTGFAAVDPAADLLCLGEMGIGNTTPAAALAAALFGGTGQDWAGPGAGSDDAGMARKVEVIDRGLERHSALLCDPLKAAQCLGGHELAAMMGATLAARMHHIPVLLDGFVCTAAAAALHALHNDGLKHCRVAHCSAEPGHARLSQRLGQKPLLDFGLRLGEGSGAALAVPLLRAALACHLGMHTFAEAGIGG
ncbi:nicotinate-nucleotide--dimethylbenzimidazole phosphoribosyltransferase [Acetobacter conturbans]|uniref:Nicotinate-nucleotide--dimethylbenzimidazole phosphoribosyltransferase n=1 Tax=Acetobacter conturbans TaxID=1737472 RepID=A0ABX0JW99_9PROT|nr:nicotinate-nucleotide--dimethylbenzimidazole phosphoribosyltransferase [Acetobacter conturbans]NHN87255.1 nicotinate-nucleotide--dimethylbenzimidazole phosphoribosyltransferase [Acetobacter conturbans]